QRGGPASRTALAGRDGGGQVLERELAPVARDGLLEHDALLGSPRRVGTSLLESADLAEQQLASARGQARLAQPVLRQRFIDAAGAGPGQNQAEPEIPVLRPDDRFVEATLIQQGGSQHGTRDT